MNPAPGTFAEERAQTDASLGAERAHTDAAIDEATLLTQRVLDDLIERDRIVVDEGLLEFREQSDSMLARRRASLERGRSLAVERRAVEEDRRAERKVTDALLVDERNRSDVAVDVQRQEQLVERSRLEARRDDTDDNLSRERDGADLTVLALGETTVALAQAERETARRREILATVAHDLRSPLCVITMNAQFIDESTTDPILRGTAQEVTRAAVRMDRLLADLLDVARIEAGGLTIIKRSHDVGEFVRDVCRSYRPLFADRGLTFTAEAPTPEPDLIASFDHDRMVQVLSNLLGNALKFMRPKGALALQVRGAAQQVEFVLQDDGPGIAASHLPHLFERFWQRDCHTRRGLGLGLFICKEIIEAHGGQISVDSALGKGTTFRFTLPRS
jgi:signal transduction histidine kinase